MNIRDLKPSISEMTPDEALALILEVRRRRRERPKPKPRKKRPRAKKRVDLSKFTLLELLEMLRIAQESEADQGSDERGI